MNVPNKPIFLKIDREVCLAKYRSFPLSPYDSNIDEEVFFFPKHYDSGWYELRNIRSSAVASVLSKELFALVQACDIQTLIFLQDKVTPWITKLSAARKDWLPAKSAVEYFKSHDLNKTFCGGVQVYGPEMKRFIRHLYNITRSDGSFNPPYFLDERQRFLGFIHFSGEVQFSALSKEGHKILEHGIAATNFILNQR